MKAVFAKAIDKFGRVDVIVNNAGYVSLIFKIRREEKLSHSNQVVLGEVEVCPLETARDQFEVMFWGPVHICKEVSDGPFVKILNMLYNDS